MPCVLVGAFRTALVLLVSPQTKHLCLDGSFFILLLMFCCLRGNAQYQFLQGPGIALFTLVGVPRYAPSSCS